MHKWWDSNAERREEGGSGAQCGRWEGRRAEQRGASVHAHDSRQPSHPWHACNTRSNMGKWEGGGRARLGLGRGDSSGGEAARQAPTNPSAQSLQ